MVVFFFHFIEFSFVIFLTLVFPEWNGLARFWFEIFFYLISGHVVNGMAWRCLSWRFDWAVVDGCSSRTLWPDVWDVDAAFFVIWQLDVESTRVGGDEPLDAAGEGDSRGTML